MLYPAVLPWKVKIIKCLILEKLPPSWSCQIGKCSHFLQIWTFVFSDIFYARGTCGERRGHEILLYQFSYFVDVATHNTVTISFRLILHQIMCSWILEKFSFDVFKLKFRTLSGPIGTSTKHRKLLEVYYVNSAF